MSSRLQLGALIVADHIYRDEGSGKYVIAGTFHHLNVPGFPTTFGRSLGIFVSFCGLEGKADLDLDFVEDATGEVLMRTRSMAVSCERPEQPVDLALEVPPLPLPRAGRYVFRLTADGTVLGEAVVFAHSPADEH